MASKRRNMFHKNKTQETTEKGLPEYAVLGHSSTMCLTERCWSLPPFMHSICASTMLGYELYSVLTMIYVHVAHPNPLHMRLKYTANVLRGPKCQGVICKYGRPPQIIYRNSEFNTKYAGGLSRAINLRSQSGSRWSQNNVPPQFNKRLTGKWLLKKFARWESSGWREIRVPPLTELALMIEGAQLIVMSGRVVLESVSLSQSPGNIKGVYRNETLAIGMKYKFQIAFLLSILWNLLLSCVFLIQDFQI
ncbi:hypothetical protein AAG570_003034 [Ranatra chinensis]|uniref:Uncharacterized protein n=1 Tax=Ranatra chinensis TaxID=642074 RepID=A0ABD0YJX1_9HEMI